MCYSLSRKKDQNNMHAVHSRENGIALRISNKILFLYSVDRMDAEIWPCKTLAVRQDIYLESAQWILHQTSSNEKSISAWESNCVLSILNQEMPAGGIMFGFDLVMPSRFTLSLLHECDAQDIASCRFNVLKQNTQISSRRWNDRARETQRPLTQRPVSFISSWA